MSETGMPLGHNLDSLSQWGDPRELMSTDQIDRVVRALPEWEVGISSSIQNAQPTKRTTLIREVSPREIGYDAANFPDTEDLQAEQAYQRENFEILIAEILGEQAREYVAEFILTEPYDGGGVLSLTVEDAARLIDVKVMTQLSAVLQAAEEASLA